MSYHVGSLANFISQKQSSKSLGVKLFENITSKQSEEIKYKNVPVKRRKEIEDDLATPSVKRRKEIEDDLATPSVKRRKEENLSDCSTSKSSTQINVENARKRVKGFEVRPKERHSVPEEDKRTIFIGNLPINTKLIKLKKLFKPYGVVESARLRCPPVSDPKIPKKVAIIKKQFHPERTNIIGYVRFSSEEEAKNALQANGMLFREHHLRVDLAEKMSTHDQKKAVFVGNLHFGAEENDIWKAFESCGPIDSIHIIRDSSTGVGKGFCYVNFKDLSSIELALKMDGFMLKDRPLRVSRAVKKVPQKEKKKGFQGKRIMKKNSKERSEKRNKVGRNSWKGEEKKAPSEVEKVKRKNLKLPLNLKKNDRKVSIKSNAPKPEEPSYLGSIAERNEKGKKKNKKPSKAVLKKKKLAFQLQSKKKDISSDSKS